MDIITIIARRQNNLFQNQRKVTFFKEAREMHQTLKNAAI